MTTQLPGGPGGYLHDGEGLALCGIGYTIQRTLNRMRPEIVTPDRAGTPRFTSNVDRTFGDSATRWSSGCSSRACVALTREAQRVTDGHDGGSPPTPSSRETSNQNRSIGRLLRTAQATGEEAYPPFDPPGHCRGTGSLGIAVQHERSPAGCGVEVARRATAQRAQALLCATPCRSAAPDGGGSGRDHRDGAHQRIR